MDDDDFDARSVSYFYTCIHRDGFEAYTEEYWLEINQYWEMYKVLGLARYFEPTPEEYEEIRRIRIKSKGRGDLKRITNHFLLPDD